MDERESGRTKRYHRITITGSEPEDREISFRLSNLTAYLALLFCCVLVGVCLGVIIFESQQVSELVGEAVEQNTEYAQLKSLYDQLQSQYASLMLDNEDLEEQVAALSATVQDRLKQEEEEAKAQAEAALPTGFPVTGSSTAAELPEDESELDLAVYYEGSVNAVVVATGSGTVQLVKQNAYGYYEVHIDHGNGYCSIYTNTGTPLIQQGSQVLRGTPIFLIQEDNALIKYQITRDSALINVYTIMSMEG